MGKHYWMLGFTTYEQIMATYRETVEVVFPISYNIAVERRKSDED